MARTYQRIAMQWKESPAGAQPVQFSFPLTSGETFVEGEILYLTAGAVKKSPPATSGQVSAANMPGLIGVAQAPAANIISGGLCPVWLADEENFFEGTLIDGANPGSAYACVAGDFGKALGLYYDASVKKWYVDKSTQAATTNKVFVYSPAGDAQVGDSDAPVLFTFLSKFYQANATS